MTEVLELATLVTADFRRTSPESDAFCIKPALLARLASLHDKVRAKFALAATATDERALARLPPADLKRFHRLISSLPRKQLPQQTEPPASGLVIDKLAKLVCEARENPFGLPKHEDVIAMLQLALRLQPEPAGPPEGDYDMSGLSLEELRFLQRCRRTMKGLPLLN